MIPAGRFRAAMIVIAVGFAVIFAMARPRPHILVHACVGCGDCVRHCPRAAKGAIVLVDGKAVIDPSRCIACARCVDICSYGAVGISAPVMAPEPKDSL